MHVAIRHVINLLAICGAAPIVFAGEKLPALEEMVKKENSKVYYPRLEFCTDNGAMIAFAGCQRLLAGQHENLEFHAKPRWDLESLKAVND